MRKILLVNFILLVVLVLIDQVSKVSASSLVSIHQNHGLFLGTFSNAPASFRIITLATMSGFILFIYFVSLYLLPNSIKSLKYSITFLQAGIFGNVIDRLSLGYTRDFIPFSWNGFKAFYNIADIFLFLAVFAIIYIIFKFDKLLWIPDNLRGNYLINPKEQLRLAFKFLLVSIFTSVLIGLFSYTFMSVYLKISQKILYDYIMLYSLLSILFSLSTFIAGIFISHRSSGPLYAFELYVEKLISGENERLKLRDGDNYKHLEQVAEKLYKHFNSK